MKHTQGEWTVEKAQFHTVIISQKSEYSICSMIKENKSWKANAKLIAAAPDLLKACKEISKAIKNQLKMEIDILVEAIAKAEGK